MYSFFKKTQNVQKEISGHTNDLKGWTMLEKFGVHILPFLGAGSGAGNISSKLVTSDINSTENFHQVKEALPQEMALVLVLAQDCNVPVQQQTNTRGILLWIFS